jgi:DNA end-binding protein Ku
MRAIWKGAISFGLVSIGVRVYSATEEKDISFHQVRATDASRIRYKRVAEADGEEVAYADIAKGYELPSGETVVLTDEDLRDLPLPTAKVVDVLRFVPGEQIDPIYQARSYYLEPEKTALKPYVLLRETLEKSGMVGLVKVAIRSREQLAALRVRDGVIVLSTMIWPDEVREPSFGFLGENVEVRGPELKMAESLVESMSGDFDPADYADNYRDALQEVIDAKIEGHAIESPVAAPTTANVVDLMSALKASVDAARRDRGETVSEPKKAAGVSTRSTNGSAAGTAKKAVAKKTPAKKAPAKKAVVAKKAPTKKVAAAKKAPARKSA